MAIFTPETIVNLLSNIPLDNTYSDSILFNSESTQSSYFLSRVKYSHNNFTYQRKEGTIRVPQNAENLWDCNYIMYKNSNFGNKWFYGFIKKVNYLNQNTSEIEFEIDVLQTWHFNYRINTCFVEREHVSDDTPGLHTVPEGFETGPYISTAQSVKLYERLGVFMYATEPPPNFVLQPPGYPVPNMVSPVTCYSGSVSYLDSFDYTLYKNIIDDYAEAGKLDAIICVFTLPAEFANLSSDYLNIPPLTLHNGYIPKNKKLLTSPYVTLTLTSEGQTVEFDYNLLDSQYSSFLIRQTFGPEAQAICFPPSYKGMLTPPEYSVSCGSFPLMAWVGNAYQNWLANNKSSLETSNVINATYIGAGSVMTLAGVANPLTDDLEAKGMQMAVNGGVDILRQMAKVNDMSVMPANSRGQINALDTLAIIGEKGFRLNCMSIRQEYLQLIDNFFTRYGYKVNETKIPNLYTRNDYNYIKCGMVNVTGNMPVDDIAIIKRALLNGITFWHTTNVGNYSLENEVTNIE